jgi:hypothetical protein
MATTRPRHLITETDPVARALDDAARKWPELAASRAKLLVRLVQEGHVVLRGEHDRWLADRRQVIGDSAGALTGCYPEGYLEGLRQDRAE